MSDCNEHLLSIRLSEADMALIDRAALLRGLSRADFVRKIVVQETEALLTQPQPQRMSADGFAAFLAALDTPAAPVPEMVELLRRPAPWEVDRSFET